MLLIPKMFDVEQSRRLQSNGTPIPLGSSLRQRRHFVTVPSTRLWCRRLLTKAITWLCHLPFLDKSASPWRKTLRSSSAAARETTATSDSPTFLTWLAAATEVSHKRIPHTAQDNERRWEGGKKYTYTHKYGESVPELSYQLVCVKISLDWEKKPHCYTLGLNAAPCCTHLITAYTQHVRSQLQQLTKYAQIPASVMS